MSLLESIFGSKTVDDNNNNNNNNNNELSSLFDKKKSQEIKQKIKKRSRVEEQERSNVNDDNNDQDNNHNTRKKDKRCKTELLQDDTEENEVESAVDDESGSVRSNSSIDEIGEENMKDEDDEHSDHDSDDDNQAADQIPENSSAPNGEQSKESPMGAHDERPLVAAEDQEGNNNNNDDDADRNDIDDVNERTIFVGNLPTSFTRKALEQLFRCCGSIESTRIRSIATMGVKVPQASAGNQNLVKKVSVNLQKVDTKAKPSIVGYVVFTESGTTIDKALQMNNTLVKDDDENNASTTTTTGRRRIRVTCCAETQFDSSRSIFVGNLPYRTDEETLRDHFCKGCDIADTDIDGVRVVRDKQTYQCKGFAYILFKDKTLVAIALRRMHDSTYMNRNIRVLVCSRRYKNNRDASVNGRPIRNNKNKKKSSNHDDDPNIKPGVAALRRILEKEGEVTHNKHKRVRGKKTNSKPMAKKSGLSKRVAAEAKTNKRVKKLQKRLSKGMGKAKSGG